MGENTHKGILMRFEWDENKNQANIKKHGIDFETASEAFSDPKSITRFDRTVGTESRFHLIGKVRGILIIYLRAASIEVSLGIGTH